MRTQETTLTVDGHEFPAELTLPDDDTDHGVVLLPGGNHGPYGDVFDHLAEALADAGVALLRFETWGDRDELDDIAEKDPGQLDAEYDAAVDLLVERGYGRVDAVGKSLGGAIAIQHRPERVDRLVLWAPGVFLEGGDVVETIDAPEDVELPTAPAEDLLDADVPVDILQGTEDNFPVANAEELAEELADARTHVIEGADHSFVGGDPEDETVETTVALLTDGSG